MGKINFKRFTVGYTLVSTALAVCSVFTGVFIGLVPMFLVIFVLAKDTGQHCVYKTRIKAPLESMSIWKTSFKMTAILVFISIIQIVAFYSILTYNIDTSLYSNVTDILGALIALLYLFLIMTNSAFGLLIVIITFIITLLVISLVHYLGFKFGMNTELKKLNESR